MGRRGSKWKAKFFGGGIWPNNILEYHMVCDFLWLLLASQLLNTFHVLCCWHFKKQESGQCCILQIKKKKSQHSRVLNVVPIQLAMLLKGDLQKNWWSNSNLLSKHRAQREISTVYQVARWEVQSALSEFKFWWRCTSTGLITLLSQLFLYGSYAIKFSAYC